MMKFMGMRSETGREHENEIQGDPMSKPSGQAVSPAGRAGLTAASGQGGQQAVRSFLKRYLVAILVPLLLILFSILAPSTFLTANNFQTILTTNAVLIILAVGETIVLVTGEFDFSFGGTLGISAAIVVMMITNMHGVNSAEAITVSFLAALFIGILNAFFVIVLRVKSFIVTLGMGTLTTGIGLGITGSQTVSNPSKFLTTVMTKHIFGVGLPFFYGLIMVIGLWVVFEFVKTGRNMYFVGEGRKAAFLAGIHVNRIRAGVLILSSVCAWLAGMVMLGQTTAVDATYGGPYLLPVFAAVFLGFTTIRSGRFNALGTFVGVLVLAIGSTGLEVLSVPSWITQVFDGGVLVIAVALANILGGERIDQWA